MIEQQTLLRSFVAVPLPSAVQTAIVEVAAELARELPAVKWLGRLGFMIVDEVHVYESQLGGEGSTYVLRHRARLGACAN